MDGITLAIALIVWFGLVWAHRHPVHDHLWRDEK